jgi:hypothetical protein
MTTRPRKRKAKTLPPLPASVITAHGDVAVVVVEKLHAPEDPTEPLFGYWDGFSRTISIRAGLHPTAAWLTLFHEQTHADLSEVGVKIPPELEEVVANAIAAARLTALRAQLGDDVG